MSDHYILDQIFDGWINTIKS